MIARVEYFLRRMRRLLSRSEWAIPLLALPVSQDTAGEPGLVLIQIDGLSRRQMERAMERGRLPFLRRLLQREHYQTRTFYPGLPTSTPAVQAELHYGVRCAVPAFGFFDRGAKRVFTMFNPECARDVEDRLKSEGEPLLQGGSSWSNIYTGGAACEETHFCPASLRFHDVFRSRPLVRALTFPIFHFPSLVKMALLSLLECFIAVGDSFRGIARGEDVRKELSAVYRRVILCIALRELVAIGVKVDIARGLPIIHANFIGYDEQAHWRGPSSAFAHWSLKGIDRAIKNIHRAAQRSGRRDYQVWVFSDHGQEATRIFEETQEATLETVISAALDGGGKSGAARRSKYRYRAGRGYRAMSEWFRDEVLQLFEEKPFTLTTLGPVGHLYFKERFELSRKRKVARHLVDQGVPSVLMCGDSGIIEWVHQQGCVTVPGMDVSFLPHPDAIKAQLKRDLEALCRHQFAGDLILLGWGPGAATVSFVRERGSHAGPGPEETQGFVLLPAHTRLPKSNAEFLRPTDLRSAVRHFLKRKPLPASPSAGRRSVVKKLRVMTYNVHGCLGVDGRISPQRIANVIRLYDPDLVALQELDFGRVRSQRHDQPRLIAEAVGLQVVFCPTVIDHDEQYGHALLGHFPMEMIRTEILPGVIQTRHVEPRGALWVRLQLDGLRLHLMNTHFGLRRDERRAQAKHLLDRDWIGSIDEDEPLIVCGDFNMFPGSEPYLAITRRLRDVQLGRKGFQPRSTFSTIHPLVRIDHIFVSRHFSPANVLVPRNDLTRVASDHLPLIADLEFQAGPS
jgi:endonuclease/exonuclease/phosphatase family metal-dependent hydrolase